MNIAELFNHSTSVIAQELTYLQNLEGFIHLILGLIVFYICKKISSSYAYTFVPRLIFVLIGIYLTWQQLHLDYIIFSYGIYSGIGFIQPHFMYMIHTAVRFYESTKALIFNTYTLSLTIYYKIYRVMRWFYDIYKKVDAFFQNRKYESKQEEQQKEQTQYEKEQKKQKKQNSYYEKQEYKNSYQQEEKTSNRDKENSDNDNSSNNQEQSSYTNNSYEEPSYTSNDEFSQFYSSDDYVVLGVSRTDDYPTIKKSYRDLAMMYHPDKNFEEWDKYNDIFQRINEAHDNLKKRHK